MKADLDAGEAEAIALAKETDADVILLDEHDARRIAQSLSVHVLGTVGVLIRAKQKGLLESLQTALDRLRDQAQFRISEALYLHALKAVGEI